MEKNTALGVWGPESSRGLGPSELCGLGLVLTFKLLSAQATRGSQQRLILAIIHCLQKKKKRFNIHASNEKELAESF